MMKIYKYISFKTTDQLFVFSEATATYQDPVTNEDYVYGIFTTPK